MALVVAVLYAAPGLAGQLSGVSATTDGQTTTVRFVLSDLSDYHHFSLNNPRRVVLDFENTTLGALDEVAADGAVADVRVARRADDRVRAVIDLAPRAKLSDVRREGDTVIAILSGGDAVAAASTTSQPAADAPASTDDVAKSREPEALYKAARVNGPVVVVIDPGHGGHDPGTRSANGLKEKDVALAIAKSLYRKLAATDSVRPVLTRDDDRFIGLRQRVHIAQEQHANLFISIHLNAYPNDNSVDGGTCYLLSQNGATDAKAAQLAQFENSADRKVAGVQFSDSDQTLNAVLTDLYQNASINDADALANEIIDEFGRVGPIYRRTPPRANFAVLRDPMIPSVLCEMAFLSNPGQASRLAGSHFRDGLATALFNGVMAYFKKNPPERMAPTGGSLYTVKSGDTLSEIAARQGVSEDTLMDINRMRDKNLRVGQKLELPHSQ